ncbi:MAG: hypothetical protein ACLFUJ_06735 [Phycisphaerae bacterium]
MSGWKWFVMLIGLAATGWAAVGAVSLAGRESAQPTAETLDRPAADSKARPPGFLSDSQARQIEKQDPVEDRTWVDRPDWWSKLPDWAADAMAWVRTQVRTSNWTEYLTIPIAIAAAVILLLTRKLLGLLRFLAGVMLVVALIAAGYLYYQQNWAG